METRAFGCRYGHANGSYSDLSVGPADDITWGIFKSVAREIRLAEHTLSVASAIKT